MGAPLEPTVSVVALHALWTALERAGADAAFAFQCCGLPPELLEDPGARVPAALASRLFEEASRYAGDDCFVVREAETLPLGAFEVFDVAVRHSETVREAIERTCRHYPLVDDRAELTLLVNEDRACIEFRHLSMPRASRTAAELVFTTIVRRLRQLTGREVPLVAVHFAGAGPKDASVHERFFRAPLAFWAPVDQLALDVRGLDMPIPGAEPLLAMLFDRSVPARAPPSAPPLHPLLSKMREAIGNALGKNEAPAIDSSARALEVSRRSLQRKLLALGTSHAAVVEDVRLTLAMDHLADPRRSIREIARAAGFGEVTAFHHAFKRWTGMTPDAYRRSQRPPFGDGSGAVCPSGKVRSP